MNTHLRSLPSLSDWPQALQPKKRPRLGQLLVASGALSLADKRRVLARQSRHDARFGEILLSHRLVDRRQLFAALSEQFQAPLVDLARFPPDPARVAALGADGCLRLGLLPLGRAGGAVVIATCRPEMFERHRGWLSNMFGTVRMAVVAESDLHQAIADLAPADLVDRAETRVPEDESCRNMGFSLSARHPLRTAAVICALILLVAYPLTAIQGFTALAVLLLLANTLLKCAVLFARAKEDYQPPPSPLLRPLMARLPRVSLLVPLFKEREIAAKLLERLDRLDYPRELLDILLIVEADDLVTQDTLRGLTIPDHMRALVVPAGSIKTKPRALNYALDFCRGSIVGIYDAEDSPAPDQILRVVRRFHERGPELACVQSILDFYNSRSNWLARCFAIEYAAWFRVILPGIVRMGLVTPLGGTSLFFRRAVLEELGGWDAHNVTEDADLGVRLARHGYRTEFIDSVTLEEANARVWPWVKQRSRWLKGYIMTWAVHMRRPQRLLRDVGAWRFLGIQLLFAGTVTHFLLAPFLWAFWLVPLGLAHPFLAVLSTPELVAMIGVFLLSEAVSLAVAIYAVRGPAHKHLIPWAFTLQFYFPLAAIAAWRGLIDLLFRPFYWDKTQHGVFAPQDEPAHEPLPPLVREPPSVTPAKDPFALSRHPS